MKKRIYGKDTRVLRTDGRLGHKPRKMWARSRDLHVCSRHYSQGHITGTAGVILTLLQACQWVSPPDNFPSSSRFFSRFTVQRISRDCGWVDEDPSSWASTVRGIHGETVPVTVPHQIYTQSLPKGHGNLKGQPNKTSIPVDNSESLLGTECLCPLKFKCWNLTLQYDGI